MSIKISFKSLLIAISGGVFLLIIAGIMLLKHLNMNDGPFYGEPRQACGMTDPDSRLQLADDHWLESFSATEDEQAATVRLIKNSQIVWCIYAHAYEHTSVESITFNSIAEKNYSSSTIHGSVIWTYGHEATIWKIKNNGELVEYWYSW